MLATIKNIFWIKSPVKVSEKDQETLSKLNNLKKELLEVLISKVVDESKTAGRQIQSWHHDHKDEISIGDLPSLESIIHTISGNKAKITINQTIDKLKRALAHEVDIKRGLNYWFQMKKVNEWYKQAFADRLLKNVLKGNISWDIKTLNKRREEWFEESSSIFISLNWEEQIQLSLATTIEETLPTVSTATYKHLKKRFYSILNTEIKKDLIPLIQEEVREFSLQYPLAKKSLYLYQSMTSITEGIDEYLEEFLPEVVNEVISLCHNEAYGDKEIFAGFLLFSISVLYSPSHDKIEIAAKTGTHLIDKACDRIRQEHISKSYTNAHQANEKHISQPTNGSSPENHTLKETTKKGRELTQAESEVIITLLAWLDIEDTFLYNDLLRYVQRMVSKEKVLNVQKRLGSRGIKMSEEVRDNFFELLESSDLDIQYTRLIEKESEWTTTNGKPYEGENGNGNNGNDIHNDYVTYKKVAAPNIDEFILSIENSEMSLLNKKAFMEKFKRLTSAQQIACKRIFLTSLQHPMLWKKKRNIKFRSLSFAWKYRIVAEEKKIVGIFSHGKDYEKLYELFTGNK